MSSDRIGDLSLSGLGAEGKRQQQPVADGRICGTGGLEQIARTE